MSSSAPASRRFRRRDFPRRIAALAVVAAMLGGCAAAPAPETGAAESTAVPAPGGDAPRFSPREPLSLDLVPGIHALTRTDEVNRIFAQWLAVPGHPEVEGAQRAAIDREIAAYLAELGTFDREPAGTDPARELGINPELVASSRTMLGIRLGIAAVAEGNYSKTYRTQWFDLGARRLRGTRELFAGAVSWQRFIDLVGEGLDERTGMGGKGAATVEQHQPVSLNFDVAGDALVELGENTVAEGAAGDVVVHLPGDVLAPLLSDFGRHAREAGTHPTGLPTPSASAPSPAVRGGNGGGEDAGKPAQGGGGRGGARVDCRKAKCVALTFDDGPGPRTAGLLDVLKKADAAATFFVVGPNAEARPRLLSRMLAEGHEIGNHTWGHRVLPSLAPERVAREIDGVSAAVVDATGTAPTLMRPPYGAVDATVRKKAGVPVILWDVDTLDWKVRNAGKVASNALRDTRPGSIVLMHDIHPSTVDAVPAILKGLRAKGYRFVTVSELLASVNPQDGALYGRGPMPVKGKSIR